MTDIPRLSVSNDVVHHRPAPQTRRDAPRALVTGTRLRLATYQLTLSPAAVYLKLDGAVVSSSLQVVTESYIVYLPASRPARTLTLVDGDDM